MTNIDEKTQIQEMKGIKITILLVFTISIAVLTEWISSLKIHKNVKNALFGISIVGYITFQVLWIYYSVIDPLADQGIVHGTARILFRNGNVMKPHILQYFAFYKQNIGITAVILKAMQIFRTADPDVVRYINVASNLFTIFGLYWIYLKVSIKNERNKLLFFILTLGFLPISLLSTWVYGDFIGLALAVWSIVFIMQYVKKQKLYYALFASICMSFSIITRSNSIIFLLAIVIYLLFTMKENKSSREKLMKLLVIGLFIIISFVPNKVLMAYVSNKYGLNDKKEMSFITYLYMGMSEGELANGWYNAEIDTINAQMQEHSNEDKTVENETKQKLEERIKYLAKNPKYTFEFYRDKILSMWAEPTMASDTYNEQEDVDMTKNKMATTLFEEKNWKIVESSQKILTFIIYVGSLIYIILKRKDMSLEMLLLVIIFLGGFSFHMLWEAKSRYIIPYVVILIPVAVSGVSELSKRIRGK